MKPKEFLFSSFASFAVKSSLNPSLRYSSTPSSQSLSGQWILANHVQQRLATLFFHDFQRLRQRVDESKLHSTVRIIEPGESLEVKTPHAT